jgi:hypothetical protein
VEIIQGKINKIRRNLLKKKILLLTTLHFIFLFLFIACNNNEESYFQMFESNSEASENSQNRSPEELSELEENIDEILKSLGGPMPYPEFNNEFENQDEKNNSEKEGEMEGDQEKEQEEKKEKKSGDRWDKILLQVNDLHEKWSRYIPKAIEADAQSPIIENFRVKLHDLTEKISDKNQQESLIVGNSLYENLIDFFDLYKNEQLNETKKIRFLIRNVIIKAQYNQWFDVEEDLERLKSTWSVLRTKLDDEKHKDKKELKNSLSYTLEEFQEIIPRQNITLTKIKGSVLLHDLKQIESG